MASQSFHPKAVNKSSHHPTPSPHPPPKGSHQAWPSTQRQSLACLLGEVSDVLYGRSWSCWAEAHEGHLPHGCGDGIHICHPPCTMWLVPIMATVGSITASSHRSFRGASWAATGDGSLSRQAITSWKPRGSVTCHVVSSSPVGNMGSDFVFSLGRCFSTLQCWTFLPPELLLQGLCFDSCGVGGGLSSQAVTSLEGCNTSLNPGKLNVGTSLSQWAPYLGSGRYWAPPEAPNWGCFFNGGLEGAGWALPEMVISGWSSRNPSGGAILFKMVSLGKER